MSQVKFQTPDYPTIFNELRTKITKENPSSNNADNVATTIDRYRPNNAVSGSATNRNWDPRKVNLTSTFNRSIKMNTNKIHSIGWNKDGSLLASGSMDRSASVSKLRNDTYQLVKIAECKGHNNKIDQVVFSPLHPEIFCTASFDKTIQFWDVRVKGMKTAVSSVNNNETNNKDNSDKMDVSQSEDLRGSSKRARLTVSDENREKSISRDRRNDREGSSARRDKSQSRAADGGNNRDDDRNTNSKRDSVKENNKDSTNKSVDNNSKNVNAETSTNTAFETLNSKHKVQTKGENINLSWHPSGDFLCVGNKYDLLSFVDARKSTIDRKGGPSIYKSIDFQSEVNEFGFDQTGQIFTHANGDGSFSTYDFEALLGLEATIEANCNPIKNYMEAHWFWGV